MRGQNWTAVFVLIFMLSFFVSNRATFADGIEFQPVPIDVDTKCSNMILQGTRRFEGVAFVLPKVKLSVSKERDPMFEIISLGDEKTLVRLGITIPTDLQAAQSAEAGGTVSYCNYDEIRHALAKMARKKRELGEKSTPVIQLAPLPITKIEISIDGVKGKFTLGTQTDADLLDYQGIDQIAEFRLNTREELNELLARLNGGIGLNTEVAMTFRARSVESYGTLRVDTSQIASKLEAAFKGRVKIVHADLAAAIATTMKALKIQVYTEGTSSQIFSNLSQSLIDKYLEQNPSALDEALPTRTSSGRAKFGEYDVQAFLQFLKAKSKVDLEVHEMGPESEKVYVTHALISPNVVDIMSKTHKLHSGRGKVSLPAFVHQGDVIDFMINGLTKEKLLSELPSKDRYFSKSELLRAIGTSGPLGKLLEDVDAEDIEEKDTASGPVAMKTWMNFMNVLRSFSPFTVGYTNVRTLMWGVRDFQPTYEVRTTENAYNMTRVPLSQVPIRINFSKVGSRWFSLQELLGQNDYFIGQYDSFGGKIRISAKQNLGNISAINDERAPNVNRVMKQFFEDKGSLLSPTKSRRFIDSPAVAVPAYRSFASMKIHWVRGSAKTFESF